MARSPTGSKDNRGEILWRAGITMSAGLPGAGDIDQAEHALSDWEILADAVNQALGARGIKRTDEMRRAREEMDSAAYRDMTYYERWIASIEAILIEKNILTKEEIDQKLAAIRIQVGRAVTPATGRFKSGDRVKVKFEDRPGHLRTPWYIRGKSGWIERVYGDFLNPELLAFGKDGLPKKTLYLVAFDYSRGIRQVAGCQRQGSRRYLRSLARTAGLRRCYERRPWT